VGLNVGDLFCLGGALSWSLYIFRLTNFMQKGGDSVQLQVRVRPLQHATSILPTHSWT
jgi:drug/metabolite transporter (DMT)-like permease